MSTDNTRNATTPCQTCRHYDLCFQGHHSCAAFTNYVNRRSWEDSEREPSTEEYDKLFNARDTVRCG